MGPLTLIGDVLAAVESFALALGASPWLLPVVLLLCCIDGFFPPVPSESIVIAVAALAVTGSVPPLYLVALVLAAALGAWCGDLIAYRIGGRVPLERLRLFRGPRGRAALAKAADALDRRGVTILLAGRFIPVGRIALNMTAGAVGYAWKRFVPIAAGAGLLWAGYAAALGIGAGHLFHDSPLLSITLGIVAGVLTGLLLDAVAGRVGSLRDARRPAEPGSRRPD
ncbi:MAG TPA: VTT domain-containing protein [Glycomyces sp.]|nr:VTT domain-containing protein [Glycomyces sp.]